MIYNLLGLLMFVGLGTGLVGIWEDYHSEEKETNQFFKITSYIIVIVVIIALLV